MAPYATSASFLHRKQTHHTGPMPIAAIAADSNKFEGALIKIKKTTIASIKYAPNTRQKDNASSFATMKAKAAAKAKAMKAAVKAVVTATVTAATVTAAVVTAVTVAPAVTAAVTAAAANMMTMRMYAFSIVISKT